MFIVFWRIDSVCTANVVHKNHSYKKTRGNLVFFLIIYDIMNLHTEAYSYLEGLVVHFYLDAILYSFVFGEI